MHTLAIVTSLSEFGNATARKTANATSPDTGDGVKKYPLHD